MAVPRQLDTVAVVGNGIIGHGIAQVFAMAGKQVRLIGRSKSSLGKALDKICASLDDFRRHELLTPDEAVAALARITTSVAMEDAAAAQLVFESVPFDIALKHEIYAQLDVICPPPTVIGSASSRPVSAMIQHIKGRERVVATHFYVPPQMVPLVEVCGGPETSKDVVPWICGHLKAAGKQPAIIEKEVHGFIGNRLQFAMLREAWSLWASGTASAEAIDTVVRNTYGRRLGITGPLESADMGGLDTMANYAAYIDPHIEDAKAPPQKLIDLVAKGHRGLPTGHGIYDWTKRDGAALQEARMEELFRWLKRDRAAR